MSDLSSYHFRKPTAEESALLRILSNASGIDTDWLDGLMVADMNDGGMGSLRLAPDGRDAPDRTMGSTVGPYRYSDLDGVEVNVWLDLDEQGRPYELDSWKVDFRPLLSRSGRQPTEESAQG